MAAILLQHEWELCQAPDFNPPFRIKSRLYAISGALKAQVTTVPGAWKRPWFASDRWRDDAFQGGKPRVEFMAAYDQASLVVGLPPAT